MKKTSNKQGGEVKSFIQAEIDKAVRKERERVIREIRLEIATYSPISAKATKELIEIVKSVNKKI